MHNTQIVAEVRLETPAKIRKPQVAKHQWRTTGTPEEACIAQAMIDAKARR